MKNTILKIVIPIVLLVLSAATVSAVIDESCTVDSDCIGICEQCDSGTGTCQYQYQTDVKDECYSWTECIDRGLMIVHEDSCDGAGSCKQYNECKIGSICSSGIWRNPNQDYYCNIVANCIVGETTAPQFYTAYVVDNSLCTIANHDLTCNTEINLQPAGTWSAPSGYVISQTEQATNCSVKLASCASNAECGFCQKCANTQCINQGASQDLKNECNPSSICQDPWTMFKVLDNCDGNGACKTQTVNVNIGNVCYNGLNTNPSANANCGTWNNCVAGRTSANQFWVGYNNGSECIDTGWVATGGTWDATPHFMISITEHAPVCQEVYRQCISNSECGLCQKCVNSQCINQASGQDLKNECNPFNICFNDWTIKKTLGTCDGNGACKTQTVSVGVGNVCNYGQNTNPSASVHCGEPLYNCVEGRRIAYQFYLGYAGDSTSTCTSTGWVRTGTNYTAPTGYVISPTEKAVSCSIRSR
jgi:hypothetical protein